MVRTSVPALVAAVVLLSGLALTGCARQAGTHPNGSASDTPTAAASLTPLTSDVGFRVTPAAGDAYELHVRVYGEPKYDKKTGAITITTKDHQGISSLSQDAAHCNYVDGMDLIVPVQVAVTALTEKKLGGKIYLRLDDAYGFTGGPNWDSFTTSIGLIQAQSCLFKSGRADTTSIQNVVDTAQLTKSLGEYAPFSFLMIKDGIALSDTKRTQLLSDLAIQVGILGPVPDGNKVQVAYLNQPDTRLLQADHCMSFFFPLDMSAQNPNWHTTEQCKSPITTVAQNGF